MGKWETVRVNPQIFFKVFGDIRATIWLNVSLATETLVQNSVKRGPWFYEYKDLGNG
jgi:hypothetical protein